MNCEWIFYLISILIQLNGHENNLVEARHAVVPMGTYSNSHEHNIRIKDVSETTIQPDYYENDRAEYFYRQQKRHKKAKKSKKLKTNRIKFEKDKRSKEKDLSYDKFEKKVSHKKRFKPKRKYGKKFVKTSLKGIDSNLSNSKELQKGKPVDIIVHIKMND